MNGSSFPPVQRCTRKKVHDKYKGCWDALQKERSWNEGFFLKKKTEGKSGIRAKIVTLRAHNRFSSIKTSRRMGSKKAGK